MIIKSEPAKITDNFYCLGPEMMPGYLLDSDHPAMFESGLSIYGPHYIEEVKKILGTKPLEYLFLTHVHFDHCGGAGYIKKEFPDLTICASEIAGEIIQKPSALETIAKLNTTEDPDNSLPFIPFTIDKIVGDGEIISLSGNTSVEVISAPGHTRDMTAYYLPEMKILIPSEAIGAPTISGQIHSEFLIDYEVYLDSLIKLSRYDAETIIMSHRLIYTGDDAAEYFPKSIAETRAFKNKVTALIQRYGDDHAKVAELIKKEEYDPQPDPKLPELAYTLNLAAKIKAVARLIS